THSRRGARGLHAAPLVEVEEDSRAADRVGSSTHRSGTVLVCPSLGDLWIWNTTNMEHNQPSSWVLLVYKIPREPTALRASVWRKLKRLGALLLHDAVWLLPANPWTREQMQWLAVEILELGGEAYVWESRELLVGQEQALVQQF